MQAITFVAPIVPGKEEEWRRFVQEVAEEHLHEYEQLRQRLGIRGESVWLMRTKGDRAAIVYVEVDDPRRTMLALLASEEPFDLWFKERLLEFHGRDLARAPGRLAAEPIFAYRDTSKDQPLAAGEDLP